jgi:hypothetical protein
MSNYLYIQSEPGLWTVGTGDPSPTGVRSGNWHPVKDFESLEAAAEHTAFLNGNHLFSTTLAGQAVELLEALSAKDQEIEVFQNRIAVLEAMNTELIGFLRKFTGNFETCTHCGGKGRFTRSDVECGVCHGTGKKIESVGVLYVELPAEGADLLLEARGLK